MNVKHLFCLFCIVSLLLFDSNNPDCLYARENKPIVPENILSMSLEDMMNVKLSTAGKKSERLADIPASAVLITRNDIEKYGYMSLEEIIENVPGMYVIDDLGAYRKTYGVRGFYTGNPRNILFLVNGVPQTDGLFDFNVMANFVIPVEAIDRIEVIRGPMAVMYGKGAFFGAINIITNDSYDETSLAAVSYGDMTQKAAAKIAGGEGEFKFSLSAGYSYSEGPDHDLNKMTSDLAALSPFGINSSNDDTDKRLERDALNLVFSGKYKNFYTDVMLNHGTDDNIFLRPSVGDGTAYHRDSAKFRLGFEHQITHDAKLDMKITYSHFDFTLDIDSTLPGVTSDLGETSGNADVFEFELDSFVNVTEDFDLTSGVYYKINTDTRYKAASSPYHQEYDDTATDDIQLWALYSQANFHPWEKLRLVGGLRVDQMLCYTIKHDLYSSQTERRYNENDIELSSNMAGIYSFNDQHILKAMYGNAVSRPSFFQGRDQVFSGYPNLKSEKIQTFEINYMALPSKNLTFGVSVFHNILNNLIVRTADGATTYNNSIGELVTDGLELSMQARIFDRMTADLSLTYQETEDQRAGFKDIDAAYSPNFLGHAKLSYDFTEHAVLSLTAEYVDDMETEWLEASNARIGNPVAGYYLLGANLRVDNLFNTGAYLNVRCSNLLDKEYYYPTSYLSRLWADKGTLGNPREFLATIGYKF